MENFLVIAVIGLTILFCIQLVTIQKLTNRSIAQEKEIRYLSSTVVWLKKLQHLNMENPFECKDCLDVHEYNYWVCPKCESNNVRPLGATW